MAHSVLAPLAASGHALQLHCLRGGTRDLAGADLVICDSVCRSRLRVPHLVHYRVISTHIVRETASLVTSRAQSLELEIEKIGQGTAVGFPAEVGDQDLRCALWSLLRGLTEQVRIMRQPAAEAF
jgi:hypothetical protein